MKILITTLFAVGILLAACDETAPASRKETADETVNNQHVPVRPSTPIADAPGLPPLPAAPVVMACPIIIGHNVVSFVCNDDNLAPAVDDFLDRNPCVHFIIDSPYAAPNSGAHAYIVRRDTAPKKCRTK